MKENELREFTVNLGKRLKMLREKNGVTQERISIEADCSKNYISALERGIHKLTVPMLIEYCRVLKISPNEILEIDYSCTDKLEIIKDLNEEEIEKVKDLIEIMRR